MKKITAFYPLFLLTLLSMSFVCMTCKKQPPQEKAYYRFTQADHLRLLPYTKGQVLKFTNQDNKERTFTIQSVNSDTIQLVHNGFLGVINLFRYDDKIITLVDNETTKWFRIHFSRLPIEYDLAKQETYTEYPSKFYASIQSIPFWNGGTIQIDYEQVKTEMTIHGKTYRNVFVLTSGNESIIDNNGHIRDVNVMYYDEIEGIIGFDDLNGNEWRLK